MTLYGKERWLVWARLVIDTSSTYRMLALYVRHRFQCRAKVLLVSPMRGSRDKQRAGARGTGRRRKRAVAEIALPATSIVRTDARSGRLVNII